MLIARLIADKSVLETGVEQMIGRMGGFAETSIAPVPHRFTYVGSSEGLELEFGQLKPEDRQFAINVLEIHFADCDWLLFHDAVSIPKVFVSDMDSTMIGQECIDELADYAGVKDRIAAITERAMQGELDFESALRERVELLKGLDESAIAKCLEERIRPNPGARELVQGMKAAGARTVLVTGGFHHFADAVGEQLGFDRVVGNRLEVEGGVLTGELAGPVSDATTKARVLAEEVEAAGEGAVSVGIGDGANDIPMMQAATFGFAYRAKLKAREAADGRIESGNLANVLALLGLNG